MISHHASDDTGSFFVIFQVFRAYSANVGRHVRGYDSGEIGVFLIIRGGRVCNVK